MGIERKMFRGMFAPSEVVQLKEYCFTAVRVFQPGNYPASELPDIAFEMGLVEKLPPDKSKNTEINNNQDPPTNQ